MPILSELENPDLLVVRVNGKLKQDEVAAFQADASAPVKASGKMGVLMVLEDFDGWSSGDWTDTAFAEERDEYVKKMAVVVEEKWHTKAEMFLLAGLRPVDIRCFRAGGENLARAWLAE